MKKIFAAIALMMPLTAMSGEWIVNDKKIAVTVAETTKDILGVDLCQQTIILAAPALPDSKEGQTYPFHAVMRIDTISPWNMEATAFVSKGLLISALKLTPQLLTEMLQGTTMRIKWGADVFTRFDLTGLTATLKTINCDKDFFPESNDSDYFL